MGAGHVAESADCEVGTAVGLSKAKATALTYRSAKIVAHLPAPLAAKGQGRLDTWRAHAVAEELRDADRDACAAVGARIHPRVCGDTARAAAGRARRALALVDADRVRVRATRDKSSRDLEIGPADGQFGLSTWSATIPAGDSAACRAAIDTRALQLRGQDPDLTAGRARADALVDLVLGHATVTAQVAFTIPVQTAITDAPDLAQPAVVDPHTGQVIRDAIPSLGQTIAAGWHIPGVGVIDGPVVAAICARFSTSITRILLDQSTGVVRETTAATYRPPKAIDRFVKLRDGTCRFPGCTVPATRCDLDHREPWPIGTTTPAGLAALCRHHHRAKTFHGWTYTMTPDAVVNWTSPHGEQYLTHPVNHHRLAA